MPEFLNYYGKLFQKSKIMERIIPREIDAKTLKSNFPYLFTNSETSEFEKSDTKGINKVGEPNSLKFIRGYSSQCMT